MGGFVLPLTSVAHLWPELQPGGWDITSLLLAKSAIIASVLEADLSRPWEAQNGDSELGDYVENVESKSLIKQAQKNKEL